ncbi:hypothetical protein HYN59_14650 [Flavobacterium album]|uniref:Nitrogen regulatory IIA protein n=1 Tax=Flavobacterium album TaxID=2175091 RepID=A0A2S1R0X6_9FLAO|nr:hypothetical protein [Flavobacterium album]AWH86272.1 hypothetical protein HYN59_14650 [Flavobacterium album]
MKRLIGAGPKWDQRLDERWRALPRRIQRRWVAGSFLLYVLLAALVLVQVRRELAGAAPADLGTIRNPITEETNNSSKKESK